MIMNHWDKIMNTRTGIMDWKIMDIRLEGKKLQVVTHMKKVSFELAVAIYGEDLSTTEGSKQQWSKWYILLGIVRKGLVNKAKPLSLQQ